MSADNELIGAHGICDNVKKVPSRQVTQVIIELPIEYHKQAVQLFDGVPVWIEPAPESVRGLPYAVIDGQTPPEEQSPATTPSQASLTPKNKYGQHAKKLHTSGFFLYPPVLKAIGTDADYRKWITTQPCIITGQFDYDDQIGEYTIACHVRRASNSGTGMKPDYSCVPMTNKAHTEWQHQHGESKAYAMYLLLHNTMAGTDPVSLADRAKAFFEKKRDELLIQWAKETLKRTLNIKHFSQATPDLLWTWAAKNHIQNYLPACYRPNQQRGRENETADTPSEGDDTASHQGTA